MLWYNIGECPGRCRSCVFGELLETLRTMELTDTDHGSYLPSYTRTALTDDLHETFGFRTDYQILLKKKVRLIIKSTK